MSILIFALCAVAALGCAVLLFRGYARTHARLLLWSACCFACLTLNSVLVIVDLGFVQGTDLFVYRNLSALVGVVFLLYGLIWEVE